MNMKYIDEELALLISLLAVLDVVEDAVLVPEALVVGLEALKGRSRYPGMAALLVETIGSPSRLLMWAYAHMTGEWPKNPARVGFFAEEWFQVDVVGLESLDWDFGGTDLCQPFGSTSVAWRRWLQS